MVYRPCLEPGCPELARKGPRCPAHTIAHQRDYDQRRGSPLQRGFDAEYARNRKIVLANAVSCAVCGELFTIDSPATCGHVIARVDGGSNELSNLRPECRRCNFGRR